MSHGSPPLREPRINRIRDQEANKICELEKTFVQLTQLGLEVRRGFK
jgi:hypothetical protein